MFKKIYLSLAGLLLCGLTVLAQNNTGAIKVVLKDKTSNETIPFANVVAYQNGVQVGVGTTNIDGEAVIKPLPPGKYDVKGVYVGYQPAQVNGVLVGEGKTAYVTIAMAAGVELQEVQVVEYMVPLVDPDTKTGQTVSREDYQNMAVKNINSVAATTAGVFQSDEGAALNVRGGRSSATTYFIDGVKVIGGLNLPQQSVDQINVITGGLPAMYGDATAGVISITTRGPQSKFFGGIELISSQLTDPYGYNSIGFSLGGPIWSKVDSTGVKTPIIGFFLAGQGNYEKDPDPSILPVYKLNDEKLKEIQNAPLVPSRTGTGFNNALEYATKDDFTTIKAHQNSASRVVALNGKIDIRASKNTNVTLGGAFEYNNVHAFSYASSLYNSENNPQAINRVGRGYVRVTQKFGNSTNNEKDKEKNQSLISNAFFSFLASYENVYNKTQDDTHKDRLFDYGYVGKFTRNYSGKEDINNYSPDSIIVNGVKKFGYSYQGQRELPTIFEASDLNPNMANYTQYLYDYYGGNFPYPFDFIPAFKGNRNGDYPQSIYNLWAATGSQSGSYNNTNANQLRFAASFNADIKNHALTLGVEYDQRSSTGYFVAPIGLWTRMRLIANNHLDELNTANPIFVPELSGTYPAYYYDNKYNADVQSEFSMKLLEKLGLPRDYTGKLNIDEMDPSTFSIDMFGAEDLLGSNSGNQLVDYYGYDHHGNKTNSTTNLNDFLTKRDAYGKRTLEVGAFRPIYMAGYIQDKFDFRDMKFNVGVRVDRYDANQKGLKDPYLVYEARTVSETSKEYSHPTNMGSNYVVYTASESGGEVKGYRNGDQWYDSKGNEISDPGLIASASGKVTPYLTDASYKSYQAGDPFVAEAFQSYKAQVNVMPRVAFSFPISDVASFFAHYDVLTKRPQGNRFDPKDYFYLPHESSTPLIANPNLKPERTVDYELGFNQILNERKNAVLKISAFYREMRDMLTLKQMAYAFPRTYLTYVNLDFGTTKGFQFEFDLRRTAGARLTANYTLQFAEGTGSNANSGINLASSGQPNLRVTQPLDYDQRHSFVITYDYRFGSGKDYKGPEFKRKDGNPLQILQDVGANVQLLMGSGTPYTRRTTASAIGSNQSGTILGSLNGSYKPWTFRANLRIDKNVELTWGKKDSDKQKHANLNIYLQILNLFNNKNVMGVYPYTGNPDDDGFLSSPLAQSTLQSLNSPQGYIDQYTIYMNDYRNYARPRTIRIGLQLDF